MGEVSEIIFSVAMAAMRERKGRVIRQRIKTVGLGMG